MTFPNAPTAGVTFSGTPAVTKPHSRHLQGTSDTEGVLKCVTPGKITFTQYIVFQHIRKKITTAGVSKKRYEKISSY